MIKQESNKEKVIRQLKSIAAKAAKEKMSILEYAAKNNKPNVVKLIINSQKRTKTLDLSEMQAALKSTEHPEIVKILGSAISSQQQNSSNKTYPLTQLVGKGLNKIAKLVAYVKYKRNSFKPNELSQASEMASKTGNKTMFDFLTKLRVTTISKSLAQHSKTAPKCISSVPISIGRSSNQNSGMNFT